MPSDPLFRFFRYDHLPSHLQPTSRYYHELAAVLIQTIPPSAERTVALRKLLESKDAAVRAVLPAE